MLKRYNSYVRFRGLPSWQAHICWQCRTSRRLKSFLVCWGSGTRTTWSCDWGVCHGLQEFCFHIHTVPLSIVKTHSPCRHQSKSVPPPAIPWYWLISWFASVTVGTCSYHHPLAALRCWVCRWSLTITQIFHYPILGELVSEEGSKEPANQDWLTGNESLID